VELCIHSAIPLHGTHANNFTYSEGYRSVILGGKIGNLFDTNNSFAGDKVQDSSGRGVPCSWHESLMDDSTLARVANDHLFASTVAKNLLRLIV